MTLNKKTAIWLIAAGLVVMASFIYAIIQGRGTYDAIYTGAVLIGIILVLAGVSELI